MGSEPTGTTRIDRLAGSLALFGGVILLFASRRLGLGTMREPGPGAWPSLLCLALVVLGAWLLIHPDPTARPAATLPPRWRRFFLAVASLLGYVALLTPAGYLVSTCMLMVFQLRWVEGRSLKQALLIAVLATTLSFYVFGIWLKIPLPAGIIPLRAG